MMLMILEPFSLRRRSNNPTFVPDFVVIRDAERYPTVRTALV